MSGSPTEQNSFAPPSVCLALVPVSDVTRPQSPPPPDGQPSQPSEPSKASQLSQGLQSPEPSDTAASNTAASIVPTTAITATPGPSRPTSQPQKVAAANNALLGAVQEQILVLRQHIVDVQDTFDTVEPEEYPQLRKALLAVSRMISQMEAAADTMSLRRLNLKNEIRTYQDENIALQGALLRERRKVQAKERNNSTTTLREGRPLPLLPRRDSSLPYTPIRPFLLPPSITRYRPLNDNDPSVIDLSFDGGSSSVSSGRILSGVGSHPGISGCTRRGRGIGRGIRASSNAPARRQSPGVRRGSVGRSRSRPPGRPGNNSNVSSPTPASPGIDGPTTGTTTIAPPARSAEPSLGRNDVNENSALNNRLNQRNNKLARNRMYTILYSYALLD